MMISDQQLLEVIKNTPLISIDIIVKNEDGRILLGLRKNEPAKGTWFVPGGRVRKDEGLDPAFSRIVGDEIGLKYTRDMARFIGVFENRYNKNFLSVPDVETYYIVLAYQIRLNGDRTGFPAEQHEKFRWFTKDEAGKEELVHEYVRPYFEF